MKFYFSNSFLAQMEAEVQKQIVKIDVPKNTNDCGSCYGAETDLYPCCETCEDVRNAYRDKGWAFTSAKDVAQVCIEKKQHNPTKAFP